MKILEQARPNLPQKPAKVASSAPAIMTSKQQPTVSKAKVESPDDDGGYSAPAVSKSAVVAKGGKVVKPAGGAAASASGLKKVINQCIFFGLVFELVISCCLYKYVPSSVAVNSRSFVILVVLSSLPQPMLLSIFLYLIFGEICL